MPMYQWRCKICDEEVDVLRSFADYEVPPTSEDAPAKCDVQAHEWVQIIGAPSWVRGANWSGSKGNW